MVASTLLALALLGSLARRPRGARLIVGTAGGLVLGIALAPLDCSIRFDYCEKLVAAGFASEAHLIHVGLSAALIVLAAVAAVLDAWRSRSPGSLAVAVVVVASAAVMFAAPTWEYLGTLQLLTLAGGALSTTRLWFSAPSLVSPP